jgi:hypothetical protein
MQQDKERFLNLETAPARLTAEETAWFLGFAAHEIPILTAKGLLKPLGHPPANGPKYFSSSTLEELRRNEKWLAKASDAIVEYWRTKNDRKKAVQPSDLTLAGVALNQSIGNIKS